MKHRRRRLRTEFQRLLQMNIASGKTYVSPATKLHKEKVLESGKQLQGIMKALVLEYKSMRHLLKCLESKPVTPPEEVHADSSHFFWLMVPSFLWCNSGCSQTSCCLK